jgi:hypothetical protein
MPRRAITLWPAGTVITIDEDAHGNLQVFKNGVWQPATADEVRAVKIEELAATYAKTEVIVCDSALVCDLIASCQLGTGYPGLRNLLRKWTDDHVTNLYVRASTWNMQQCRTWLQANGHPLPNRNPWAMIRAELIAAAYPNYHSLKKPGRVEIERQSDAEIREKLIKDMDAETTDGLDEFRAAVNENAGEVSIYEWWRVTPWLADELRQIGEPLLSNVYGQWWGRTRIGHPYIQDGTLQAVAAQRIPTP